MVVGLPEAVVELEGDTADRVGHLVGEGGVGTQGAVRQESLWALALLGGHLGCAAELTLIDDLVVTGRLLVAIEAWGDVVVADDPRDRSTVLLGVGGERATATDVVEVTVGVDDGVDRCIAPRSQRLDHRRSGGGATGVERHQSITGVDDRDMTERLDEHDAIGQFADLLGDPVWRGVDDAGVDQSRRECQWMFAHRVSLAVGMSPVQQDHRANGGVLERAPDLVPGCRRIEDNRSTRCRSKGTKNGCVRVGSPSSPAPVAGSGESMR